MTFLNTLATFKGATYHESSSLISEISVIMTSVPETPNQKNLTSTLNVTPVPIRFDCSERECTKTFANKKNMTKHKDKFHMMVNAVSKSQLSTLLGHFSVGRIART